MLRLRVHQLKERWAAGEFTDLSQFGTAILNAKAIGNCEAYEKVAELDFEDIIGELADEEPKRADGPGPGSVDQAV